MSKRELRKELLKIERKIQQTMNGLVLGKVFFIVFMVGGALLLLLTYSIYYMTYGAFLCFVGITIYSIWLRLPEKLEKLEDEYNELCDELDNIK